MSHNDDFEFEPPEGALSQALEWMDRYRPSPSLAGNPAPVDLPRELPAEFPQRGIGQCAALERLAPLVLGGARRLDRPGFFAHMDPPTPWITWVLAMWNASLNQNLLHAEVSPAARQFEQRVVDWLAPHFGMQGGHLVPGSTVANLTALWAARELKQVREVVASAEAHLSVRKSAAILGLPYREVRCDADQRLIECELGDVSRSAVVLTAGTTVAGAIDPLGAASDAAWRHVDAAWAGPLRLSPRHAVLLEGIERCDSVAISAHKWLFQPKESALVLFARADEAHRALTFGGAYLATPNVGVLGSHGAAAVPLLATLLAWGREGIAARIDHCMELAATLARLVRQRPEFELFAEPVSGIVLWRPRSAEVQQVRARLRHAFVSLATVDGASWFRSVAANPLADPEAIIAEVSSAISPL